ncbi:unnamed protein product [Ambrosiozyma monospora]|uniref:Unnamed protein product n=1 Tax=Ambrosiozyma monospora TaxID=43982 RepID=A0ACB5SV15_AMBMO|nr:unnamed protein product [Ambrosiozyma monospora]
MAPSIRSVPASATSMTFPEENIEVGMIAGDYQTGSMNVPITADGYDDHGSTTTKAGLRQTSLESQLQTTTRKKKNPRFTNMNNMNMNMNMTPPSSSNSSMYGGHVGGPPPMGGPVMGHQRVMSSASSVNMPPRMMPHPNGSRVSLASHSSGGSRSNIPPPINTGGHMYPSHPGMGPPVGPPHQMNGYHGPGGPGGPPPAPGQPHFRTMSGGAFAPPTPGGSAGGQQLNFSPQRSQFAPHYQQHYQRPSQSSQIPGQGQGQGQVPPPMERHSQQQRQLNNHYAQQMPHSRTPSQAGIPPFQQAGTINSPSIVSPGIRRVSTLDPSSPKDAELQRRQSARMSINSALSFLTMPNNNNNSNHKLDKDKSEIDENEIDEGSEESETESSSSDGGASRKDLEEENEALRKKLNELETRQKLLRDVEVRNSELISKLKNFEDENEQLKKELDDHKLNSDVNDDLTSRISQMEENYDDAMSSYSLLEKHNDKLNDYLDKLRQKNAKLSKEVQTLHEQLDSTTDSNTKLAASFKEFLEKIPDDLKSDDSLKGMDVSSLPEEIQGIYQASLKSDQLNQTVRKVKKQQVHAQNNGLITSDEQLLHLFREEVKALSAKIVLGTGSLDVL